jgi:D-amino-acid oxidase
MRSLDRRSLITLAAATATGALLPGCRPRPGVATGPLPADDPAWLPPVWVRPDRIIRTVVGHRPFRPAGFVVRAETLGAKTVIHNYGHGGGGISLSWGSAAQAVRLADQTGARRFAVLGAGVIGLSTARLLQERGYDVTIYTAALPLETTSAVAGAQWSPTTIVNRDRVTPAFIEQYLEACHLAHRRFQSLVGERYGIRWLPNYFLSPTPPDPARAAWGLHLLPDLLRMGPVLPPGHHPFPGRYAQRLFTMMIEPSRYLPALLEDFRSAGGRLVLRAFADADQIGRLDEPVVVNCTGLGARRLFGDEELTPIKGQLVFLVPQPEVQYATLGDALYMFPRRDGILLGGTFERGDESTEADPAQTERIVTGHRAVFEPMAREAGRRRR